MANFGFLGALQGLGAGASQLGANMEAEDRATQSFNRQQALEQWRMQTAQQYKVAEEARATERAEAPLKRLSASAQAKAEEDIPVSAAPVRTLTASPSLQTGGITGDYAAMVKRAESLPEADRAPYLAQLEAQRSSQQQATNTAAAGQTRKRSPDEAFDAALEEAKLKDPVAYKAGKPLATDKTVTVPDGAAVIDQRSGKIIYDGTANRAARETEREDRRDERMAMQEEGRDRRQMQMLSAQEKLAGLRAGNDGGVSKQERLIYNSRFSDAGRRMTDTMKTIRALQGDTAFMMAKPGDRTYQQLESLQQEYQSYKEERDTYGALLEGVAKPKTSSDVSQDEPSPAPAPSTAPARAPVAPTQTPTRDNSPTPSITKSEYEALPKGALYVKDGKTYRKG